MQEAYIIIYENGGLQFQSTDKDGVEEFRKYGNGIWVEKIIKIVPKAEFMRALGCLI